MPLTKKCKKISESRCSPHEGDMSPECELSDKNRCIKKKVKVTKKTIKKECPPGKILNPKTNRCIKDPSLTKKTSTKKTKTKKATKKTGTKKTGTKKTKATKPSDKLLDVLHHTITINGHGGFNKQKITVPEGFQVLIPHENGLDSDYTTPDAGKNKLFEEDLYVKHYFNYRYGWKLYLPGDLINNLQISSFSDSSSCKDIKKRHLIQKSLIEKCSNGSQFNAFCPLFCTTVNKKKDDYTHLKYKNKNKLKIKSCSDYFLSDLFSYLRPMLSNIPDDIRDTISPGKDEPIVLIPFTCNAKPGNKYIDEGTHTSGMNKFKTFQINKKGHQLINEKNNTYLLTGMSYKHDPKIKLTSENKWICKTCTYHNELQTTKCEICYTPAPESIKFITYINQENKNDIVYLWHNNGGYRINTENDFNTSKKITLGTNNFFAFTNTSKLQSNYNKLYDKH